MLSQASIAAVSLASIGFNLRKRHPLHPDSKTLIDYEMCLTMTPALVSTQAAAAVVWLCCWSAWLMPSLLNIAVQQRTLLLRCCLCCQLS